MLKIEGMHDMQEYLALLSDSLTIYMDDERLVRACEDAAYAADDNKWLALLQLRIESGGLYFSINPENILDYLFRIGVDTDKYCINRKTGSPSLDQQRVLQPLVERGIAVDVLTAYMEYKSSVSYSNFLRKLESRKKFDSVTDSGRTLVSFATHVEEQDNLRAYYNNIAVVSVPKKYNSIITGKSDKHFLGWCDYPQADWRFAYNLFIRGEDNEQVMRECDDAYEGLARLVEGDKFDPDKFKDMRKEYKVHCLSVFYNSQNNSPVAKAMREYFCSREKYARLLFDLNALYHFKLPIPCTSYFGFTQLIPEGAYNSAFMSKGLNTPIQTFTSHIVNETVFGILEKFWSLGYTKNDINVYYVRHDEPIFMMTQAVIKDAWIFKECSEIYIPGFTPIHLDFHFGRYYTEEDERITEDIRKSIETSDHVYARYDDADYAGDIRDYHPYPSVESVYVRAFSEEGGRTRVKVYDYRTGRMQSFYSDCGDPVDALYDVLNNGMLEWLGTPEYLLVRNASISLLDKVGPDDCTLMKVIDKYDSSIAGVMDNG